MARNFEDLIEDLGDNLLIVDSLNMSFRWRKQIDGWASKLNSTIASLANSYSAQDVLVLGDGGSTYRKNIYPEYKLNRLREEQTEEEKQEWENFFNEYELAMSLVTYPVLKFKGIEADDIAAYIVKEAKNEYDHIWLISSDRDWDLLLDDNVSRFSLFSRKEFTKDNWNEHYPYPLCQHLSVKVLMGDSGDNIPGVKGIGEKRAFTILDKYGPSAYDVRENLPIKGTSKYIQELNKFGDNILRNYELIDLVTYCDEAIKEHKKDIDNIIKELK